MKQTRKIKSPTSVTFGFVDDGEIIGILFSWQIGAASSERDDATSPRIATTPSLEINLRTTVAGWPACDWSSSVSNRNFPPRTPPAALRSSIAICVPLCDDWPNVASLPVSDANSPTLMTSLFEADSPDGLLQPTRIKQVDVMIVSRNCLLKIFIKAPCSILCPNLGQLNHSPRGFKPLKQSARTK